MLAMEGVVATMDHPAFRETLNFSDRSVETVFDTQSLTHCNPGVCSHVGIDYAIPWAVRCTLESIGIE